MAVANIKKAYKGTQLMEMVREARERTFGLVADLTDEQLLGPRLAIVNPPRWEIGHVAWFQERWVLRHAASQPPLRAGADSLYDSAAVPHDVRWDIPLPTRQETLSYLGQVRDRVLARLGERGLALWSEVGWRWREAQGAEHPVYWHREGPGRWLRRDFDAWVPLEPHRPAIHVTCHEADAFCRWAGRRLPTELEWEVAASG